MSGSIIATAGMMGSGKTTLARVLGSILGWTVLPEDLRSRSYLNELFKDENRWAFDVQVSFLCDKAIKLKSYYESGENIILDRSLFEDADIFAFHFYSTNKIDERSYRTYKDLSEYFFNEIPSPDLIVYCECSLSEIKKRLYRRYRDHKQIYPEGHIPEIYKKYKSWFQNFERSALCRIDSEKYDFRIPSIGIEICDEIKSILTNPELSDKQIHLPGFYNEIFKKPKILEQVIPIEKALSISKFKKTKEKSLSYPLVYIAAPFTSKAASTKRNSKYSGSLFEFDVPHGIIEKGTYRNALNSISNRMKRFGFSVILPHRDINKWGKKMLTPEDVFVSCTQAVKKCDLFIGVLGFSHGSHYELGVAMGQKKPVIAISSDDFQESFIAQGIQSDYENVLHLKCSKLNEIKKLLKSPQVIEFLRTFFQIKE